jgi:dihydrolipoamide dehydrogenase
LLDSSEHYHNATHTFKTHGIDIAGEIKVNLAQMINRKREVIKATVDGINFLMKKNKITVYKGLGSFKDKNTITITKAEGSKEEITTANTIIATGSKPIVLPSVPVDKKRIITSTEALEMTEVPKHLILIGGGVIGLELGSVYARLGSKVTVVEFLDSIIPTMDRALGKELQKSLTKLGFEFAYKHKVTGAKNTGNEVVVTAEDAEGKTVEFKGDYCIVAVGRKAFTEGLALENAGLKADERGKIPVNEQLETATAGIYAIGDVIKGAMLAHKAEEEGVFVAETIVGQKPHIHYNLIPGVVYTWPEVAGVGATEEELKTAGKDYKMGNFPFKALGRARASMDTDGFVKVLADKKTT